MYLNVSDGLSRRTNLAFSNSVMPGLAPPARPKPLRRGEGPGIHVVLGVLNDVDGRDKPGHDDVETDERTTPTVICETPGVRGDDTCNCRANRWG
ncbi:hypothetical protein ACQR1I_29140 [Bradyrhizobium sp. HKCCYLS2038]|uniref:hypothetical protein n=1 Tax=unclassified Bradyrhizobium TaxID=2631580 RepID=UPI003EBDB1BA